MQILKMAGINTGSAAGIRGVPTVIVYKKGVEVDRKVGGVPLGAYERIFKKISNLNLRLRQLNIMNLLLRINSFFLLELI